MTATLGVQVNFKSKGIFKKNVKGSRGVQRSSLDSGAAEDSMNIESLSI
jgi:hypothetical protein